MPLFSGGSIVVGLAGFPGIESSIDKIDKNPHSENFLRNRRRKIKRD